ncbi:MAG: permease-like cell division protein FtsX [Thiofilum sp.]|uniref:permease-like cell division protein FtsX n=1 Tax=Thiofilum sp. TaxID=2212733 RepID=UPI0025E3BE7A|nr:permease-like cell division protein FtsX [Thiofilum sp.]MBK8451743.1 cell division protein FtsX [Thiofilum sp.]
MAKRQKNATPMPTNTTPETKKPRTQTRPSGSRLVSAWWNQQKHAMQFSLQRLWFNSISTWITLATIAIALSLPTSMHLLLKNLQTLTDDKREVPTITLFLKKSVNEQQAKDRAELLSELNEVYRAQVITRDEGLADFRQISGFAETLESLKDNPFPHVIVVTPKLDAIGELDEDIDRFTRKLKAYPEVDNVQIDIEWVQKLRTIFDIVERIVLVVSILLGLTVLLVIGNTIRLDIENRREEIKVTRLIGATNAYVRRPFLYGGIWLGLFGGILSLAIVQIAFMFLINPVQKLATQYGSTFTLSGLAPSMTLNILLASIILGLIGAWIAVGRHLRKAEMSD